MNVLDLEGLRYFYQQYVADLQKAVNVPGRPDILSGMTMLGGSALSNAGNVVDEKAQYKVIQKPLSGVGDIFSVNVSLPKGLYSAMIRMKVSNITSSENVFKLEIRDSSNVTAKYIKPNMFRKADTYMTIGCVVENTSGTLQVALKIDKALVGQTVSIDYLALSPAMVGITSIG